MRSAATWCARALAAVACAIAACVYPAANEVAGTGGAGALTGTGGVGKGGAGTGATGGASTDGGTSGMVQVPAGVFHMGCTAPQNCQQDSIPDRDVTLGAFAIDVTEVQQSDYQKCVAAKVCPAPDLTVSSCDPSLWAPDMPSPIGRADQPVVCIPYTSAVAYCGWLGKRLPTEAEWEKAARGTDRRAYPWGDLPVPDCQHAMYSSCANAGLAPVTGFAAGASPYGALDMAGNAAEMVSDWYDPDYYGVAPAVDPQGPAMPPSSPGVRAVRGGSYYVMPDGLFVWVRDTQDPSAGAATLGFRCAKSTP